MFCHLYLTKMCITCKGFVQSFWNNVPHPNKRSQSGDTKTTTLVPCVKGLRSSHMVNISEVLINIVNRKQPKVLIGCDQKGIELAHILRINVTQTLKLSVERHDLSDYKGVHMKLGKPVCFPMGKLPVKEADRHAGKGSWRKRKLVSNRQDRAGETRDTQLERVQNSNWSQMTKKLVRSQRIVASAGA